MKDKGASLMVVFIALLDVFKKPSFIVLGVAVSYVLLLIASLLPNLALTKYVMRSGAFSVAAKLWSLINLKGLSTNASALPVSILVIVAVLAGINIALLVYYLRRRFVLEKSIGTTAGGMILALFGIGCASCGSVILVSLFGVGATASIVGFLPFDGLEFQLLAVVSLLFSIYTVAKKLNKPLVC